MENEQRNFTKLKAFIALLFFGACLHAQVFIVGDTQNPSATFVDIPDTILPLVVKGHFNFDIDIDFDGISDIRFHRNHHSSPHYNSERYSVLSLNNIQFVVVPGSSYADTLSQGTIVDNSLNWNNSFGQAIFYHYYSSFIPPPWGQPSYSHGICIEPDTYIGFRKINEMDTLYGWFNLDLLSPYRVKSYAVNKRFGAEPTTPPENVFNLFPNPASQFVAIENNFIDGEYLDLLIYNSNGQIVFNTQIYFSRKHSINLNDISNGLYLLVVKNDREKYSTKFFVIK